MKFRYHNNLISSLTNAVLPMVLLLGSGLSVDAMAAETLVSSASTKTSPETGPEAKGFLDNILKIPDICIGPFCLDPGEITERLLADQLREMFQENAPLTVSTDSLYPVQRQLTGAEFQPRLLYLGNAEPDAIVPPGDYVLFVQVYCLQQTAASPDGYRYRLGEYGGTRQPILQALNQTAATADFSHSELQGLSWFIQSGGVLKDMPNDMQAMVQTLIPEHRETLEDSNFLDEINEIADVATGVLGYSSFESFLSQELGDLGQVIVGLIELQDQFQQPQDWRSLSDSFFSEARHAIGTGNANVLDTPWSQIRPNVQARFMTEGNANDVGTLMMRVEPEAEPLTVAELTDRVTGMTAIPEGNSNVQPLAMTPMVERTWWEDLSIGFGDLGFFAGRQLCSAGGAVSRSVGQLCDYLGDIQEVIRPDTDAGFPELSEIPDLGDFINRRRRPDGQRSPESPSREEQPPVPANDNNRPPVPANDNNRPPVPANDNNRP